jgi:hypothetical protein
MGTDVTASLSIGTERTELGSTAFRTTPATRTPRQQEHTISASPANPNTSTAVHSSTLTALRFCQNSRRRAAACLTVFLTLISCSGNSAKEAPISTDNTILDAGAVESGRSQLPLESVLVVNEENKRTIRNVIDRLTDICMKGKGFDFEPYPSEPYRSPLDIGRRYGAIDDGLASEVGYRDPTEDEWRKFYAEVEAVNSRRPQDAVYQTALYGTGSVDSLGAIDRGCDGRATIEVYGYSGGISELPGYQDVVDMQADSGKALYASDAGRAVVQEWARCMAKNGYAFTNWWDARQLFPHAIEDLSPITEDEITTSSSDAACRRDIRFEERLLEIESQLLSEAMETKFTLISEFQNRLKSAVDRATKIHDDPDLP